jgi:hypothetical protein
VLSSTSLIFDSLHITDKIENKKYHTVGGNPKSNIKIIERVIFDTLNTQIHDRSIPWLGTSTTVKYGDVKLILLAQT